MSYTITQNAQFHSVEILFDAKPSEAVRSALKQLKFRWHNQRGIWYGYRSESEVREAIENACPELINNEVAQTKTEQTKEPKAAKVDRDMLRAEFAKAWNSRRMIDYCVNKVAAYAELPGGELITVDKQSIETRFCFGESGYDFDDAVKAAAHEKKVDAYLKRYGTSKVHAWTYWRDA